MNLCVLILIAVFFPQLKRVELLNQATIDWPWTLIRLMAKMWNRVAYSFTCYNYTTCLELPSFSAVLNKQRDLRLFKSPESTCEVIKLGCLFMKCLDFLWSENAFGICIEIKYCWVSFLTRLWYTRAEFAVQAWLPVISNSSSLRAQLKWICNTEKRIVRWQDFWIAPGFKFAFLKSKNCSEELDPSVDWWDR